MSAALRTLAASPSAPPPPAARLAGRRAGAATPPRTHAAPPDVPPALADRIAARRTLPALAASSPSSSASATAPRPTGGAGLTVADVMTRSVVTVGPDTTVDEALDLLVSKRITGLPVVDGDGKVIGVVSDFDLLPLDVALDDAPGSTFPAPGAEWAPFLAVKEAAAKAAATRVADVMTADPVVVAGGESLAAAARTLLAKRVRRLPVVDGAGRLIGLFSRSDLLKTAWAGRHGGLV